MIENFSVINSIVLMFVVLSGFIDFKTRKIPNYITFSFVIVALLYNIIVKKWGMALIGFVISFILGSIFFMLGGMGGGDVKLMIGIASALGTYEFFSILLIASIIGAIWGIVILLNKYYESTTLKIENIAYQGCLFKSYLKTQLFSKGKEERTTVPFGTCLAIAVIIHFFII